MILKFSRKSLRIFVPIAFLILLSACSSSDNATNTGSTKTTTALPLAALTVPNPSGLSAHIILDGNTTSPIAMTIDTGAGTATANITGLTLASHTVQIVYEYNDGVTTYTLAQSTVHTVDLTGGSATYSIPDTDYNTASFDDDSDGLSNALELAAGTDPGDSGCVLGISLVGSCTL